MPFIDSLDIANRVCQHIGATQIDSPTEDSNRNKEITFAYDKLRRAELRRNVWRFAIRKAVLRAIDTTTLLLNPPAYSAAITYLPGALVKDTNSQIWVSRIADNINNSPGGNNESWDMYFGPMTASLYSSTQSYFSGEVVYMAGTDPGTYMVYRSLQNANTSAPNVATAWDATVTYNQDATVSYLGSQWRSLLVINTNNAPADGANPFDATATYSTAQTVTGSDNLIYSSVGNGNIGHDPVTDAGVHWTNTHVANAWSRTPTLTVSAQSWLPVGNLALTNLNIFYPLGSGPSSQSSSRNAFRLPAGYLRTAPQDTRAGSTSYLGAPSGLAYNDWQFESDYFVSSEVQPIIFRFVADVTQVRKMDDMFCEGLGARIASEVCERITQSGTKLQTIASAYKLFMGEARTVNAIEVGSEEPPLDDYVACRA